MLIDSHDFQAACFNVSFSANGDAHSWTVHGIKGIQRTGCVVCTVCVIWLLGLLLTGCLHVCCVVQESKSGPVTVQYSSFSEAMAVGPDQLGINTHPMYHVMQGVAAHARAIALGGRGGLCFGPVL
jgi:hypothetical protein